MDPTVGRNGTLQPLNGYQELHDIAMTQEVTKERMLGLGKQLREGVGICGVYTYEVAETKVAQVMDFSRQHQHPLQCTMEKE